MTREDLEPVADVNADAIITLLYRPVDVPSGVFHNIQAGLLAVSSRLRTIAEAVSRGTESRRSFLQTNDKADRQASSTPAGTPARNE